MLRDILNDAINLAGVPISDRQFIRDYNRIAHDLAMLYDTAKARGTKEIACDAPGTEYSLSEGCLRIERVETSCGNYFSFYEVRGNSKIVFRIKGTYKITELFDQEPVTTMEDDIEINPAYAKAMAEFIAAKAVKKSDPELSKDLIASSAADAEVANKNIRRMDNPNKRVYTPLFR